MVCASSSHMAWTAIDKTFQAQTRAHRMALKAQLQTLNKGSLSMIEYIKHKLSIADSLAENLHPISDEDLVGYLLSGLDSSYGPFSTAFMMKDAYASVDDLAGLLLQEEARLEQDHARHATPVTLPSQVPPLLPTPTAYTATHCSTRPAPNNTQSNNSGSFQNHSYDNRHRRPTCQICNKPGHEAIDC